MKTIIFANQKGGTGKTTSANETAHLLAKDGNKVLILDLDSQGNLTNHLDLTGKRPSIFDVLTGVDSIAEGLNRIKDKTGNLYAIPGSRKMLGQYFSDTSDVFLLREMLDHIQNEGDLFDYVIIDVGPAAGAIMTMALLASDYVVAMTMFAKWSLDGLLQLYADMKMLHKNYNGFKAKVIGILAVDADNTNVTKMKKEELTEIGNALGGMPFHTVIRHSKFVREVMDFENISINEYAKSSPVAFDYRHYYYELQERIADDIKNKDGIE